MAKSNAAVAEETPQVAFRGRRPHMDTLDSRMIDLQTEVEKAEKRTGKVAAKRLTAMNEQAQELAYHFNGHKEKGVDIGSRLEALEVIQNRLATIVVLPSETKAASAAKVAIKEIVETITTPTVQKDMWDLEDHIKTIQKIRQRRLELLEELASLDVLENEQFVELGRVEAERILAVA